MEGAGKRRAARRVLRVVYVLLLVLGFTAVVLSVVGGMVAGDTNGPYESDGDGGAIVLLLLAACVYALLKRFD